MLDWLRRPWMLALLAGAAVILAAFVPVLWRMLVPPTPTPSDDVPWNIESVAGAGTQVFGLSLPGATLADVVRRWGEGASIAVMARPGEPGTLEAYVENPRAGGIGGRLVLAAQADAAEVLRWRARAVRDEAVSAETRRYTLHAQDLEAALRAPIVGITFLPAADLDEGILIARFGRPEQRLRTDARLEHWLYPRLGLAIAVHERAREVLQYVAPGDFERRLQAPLQATPAVARPAR